MKLHKLFNQPCVSFYPALYRITNHLEATLMLQQLMYWWDKKDGEELFKTIDELEEETCLTPERQLTASKKLVALGFIRVTLRGIPARRHFWLDVAKIDSALEEYLSKNGSTASFRTPRQLDTVEDGNYIQEITAETTPTGSDEPGGVLPIQEEKKEEEPPYDPSQELTVEPEYQKHKASGLGDQVSKAVKWYNAEARRIRKMGDEVNYSGGMGGRKMLTAILKARGKEETTRLLLAYLGSSKFDAYPDLTSALSAHTVRMYDEGSLS